MLTNFFELILFQSCFLISSLPSELKSSLHALNPSVTKLLLRLKRPEQEIMIKDIRLQGKKKKEVPLFLFDKKGVCFASKL